MPWIESQPMNSVASPLSWYSHTIAPSVAVFCTSSSSDGTPNAKPSAKHMIATPALWLNR